MKIISIGNRSNEGVSLAIDNFGSFITSPEEISKALIFNQILEGSYAFATILDESSAFLTRDNLGSRKLFYFHDVPEKCLYVSNNYIDLTDRFDSQQVFSVPRGGYLLVDACGVKRLKNDQEIINNSAFDIAYVESTLIKFFKFLKYRLNKKPLVCLSGGLDSTIIAHFATKEFGPIDVITGVLQSSHQLGKSNDSDSDSDSDFYNARLIANSLNARFHPVFIFKEQMLDELKNILRAAQDWRDYNVHCAALNYYLAKNIKDHFNPKDYVVLTGDFMNEIFADYTSEFFDGEEFYKQPNFNQKTRQRFFMNGLDSSDREIGVFESLGFDCIQPYSFVANYYRKLSNEQLSRLNAKYLFNGKLLPEELLGKVGRSKVRAQVGDSSGGVLGHFISLGLSQQKLEDIFCEYFSVDKKFIKQFIEIGSYRCGSFR